MLMRLGCFLCLLNSSFKYTEVTCKVFHRHGARKSSGLNWCSVAARTLGDGRSGELLAPGRGRDGAPPISLCVCSSRLPLPFLSQPPLLPPRPPHILGDKVRQILKPMYISWQPSET